MNRRGRASAARSPASGGKTAPAALSTPSALALVLANLVPVAGTVLFGWRLSDVMVLYWAESAVIGFFNLCKMAVIGRWSALFSGLFFVIHFGGFMAGHFVFLYTLFVAGPGSDTAGVVQDGVRLLRELWPALAALFLSHAWSFFANFIGQAEYRGRTLKEQMAEPYSRIVLMHVVLIFGGFVVMSLGQPTPVVLAMIALKIGFDLRAHAKQRKTAALAAARTSTQSTKS